MPFSLRAFSGDELCTVCSFGGVASVALYQIVNACGAPNGSYYCEMHGRRGVNVRNAREAFLVTMGLERAEFEVQQRAWMEAYRTIRFDPD